MESSILSEVDDTSILRTGLSTPLSLSSRLVTDPSAHAPAQRAGAQRLCALAHRDGRRSDGQPSLLGHCGHGPIFIAQRAVANDPHRKSSDHRHRFVRIRGSRARSVRIDGSMACVTRFRLIGTLRAPLAAASYLPQEQFGVQSTAQKDPVQVASRDARQNTSLL
jgi:hypothetical protein